MDIIDDRIDNLLFRKEHLQQEMDDIDIRIDELKLLKRAMAQETHTPEPTPAPESSLPLPPSGFHWTPKE